MTNNKHININSNLSLELSGNSTDYILAHSKRPSETFILKQSPYYTYSPAMSTIYLTKPMMEKIIKAYHRLCKENNEDE